MGVSREVWLSSAPGGPSFGGTGGPKSTEDLVRDLVLTGDEGMAAPKASFSSDWAEKEVDRGSRLEFLGFGLDREELGRGVGGEGFRRLDGCHGSIHKVDEIVEGLDLLRCVRRWLPRALFDGHI
ncbi:hypothetical protein HYQ46_009217 [Verticillium longisporum]|nr:hypothetical protein HYQ46_009217 [Verticillium longisporum]